MCEHCSELVWITLWRLEISQCTWGCGRIRVKWLKRNHTMVELFKV
jgi:hypothetical protein